VQTAAVNQNSTLVRKDIAVLQSQADNDVVVINSKAASDSKIIVQQAYAKGITLSLNATATAYRILKDKLGYSSPELLYHLFLENVRGLTDPSKLVVDMDTAIMNF